jgi:hypothetical protein
MPAITGREEQKQRELRQFRALQRTCNAIPACRVEQPLEPEPDIVLFCPEGQIGIEFTEIHPSGVEKRSREGEQEILIATTKRLYEETGHPPVNVYIDWSGSPPLSKKARETSARLLCDLVVQNLPSGEEQSRNFGDGETLIHPSLPIREVSLFSASSRENAEWREWNFHDVVPPDPADLRERILFEESKIDRYKGTYKSWWLVLVAGAGGPSTWTVTSQGVSNQEFRSQYNRIFLLLMDRDKCVELRKSS